MAGPCEPRLLTSPTGLGLVGQGRACAELFLCSVLREHCLYEANGKCSFLKSFFFFCRCEPILRNSFCVLCVRLPPALGLGGNAAGSGQHLRGHLEAWKLPPPGQEGHCCLHNPHGWRRQVPAALGFLTSLCRPGRPGPQQITWVLSFTFPLRTYFLQFCWQYSYIILGSVF